MLIRDESLGDYRVVEELYLEAFDTPAEARLLSSLRFRATPLVSLIIEEGMRLVGHIMFTPVTLNGSAELNLMGLAPMAVIPDRQRCGFGSALVEEGLIRCQMLDCGAVVVLGHPEFYPRFGFRPAAELGINCEYDVPADVFMALELAPGYLENRGGSISYHPSFNQI